MADFSKVHEWIRLETGLTSINEYQNAPAPTDNYIGVYIRNKQANGQAHITHKTGDIWELARSSVVEVQLRCINDSSADILEQLKLSLDKESVQSLLYSGSLAVNRSNDVITQPTEHNGKWEHQSILEIFFHSTASIEDDRSYIETVELISEV